MRAYFILTTFLLSSLLCFSQALELEKASPFTAVAWEVDQPIVQFENEWYYFEKLDDFGKNDILDFCKNQFGKKWQKRFSEDLVEVLERLGYQPNTEVRLELFKDGVSKVHIGTFTSENRQRVLQYNRTLAASRSTGLTQKITIDKALEDINQFEEILNSRSSYSQLSNFNYTKALKNLADDIIRRKTDVDRDELTNDLAKIMSEIGDRHASIRNEAFNRNGHKTYNLGLPFGVASLNGKLIALRQRGNKAKYNYYDNSHPYIKSIDGIAIEALLENYNYKDKKAPKQVKLTRGSRAIQKYGALLFQNNMLCPDSIKVIFTDGALEKEQTFQLTTANKGYSSKLLIECYSLRKRVESVDFDGLSKIVGNNIGYINLPQMYHYEEIEGLEAYFENTLNSFSETKALIIDIRNNPGGGRVILQTFARYIVPSKQSPWVANVAYLRTEATIMGDEESMSGRYLYSYNSEQFTDQDRTTIDDFNTNFQLQKAFDRAKFSTPFYMILHNGTKPYTQPVFILVNERSFSAASVFASAFKGLPNVKIVGVTTDGSSGNSKEHYLINSNIRVKVSTMLSFQRNGKTLDGNGTEPDIIISADKTQVLTGVDTQLNKLIDLINNTAK